MALPPQATASTTPPEELPLELLHGELIFSGVLLPKEKEGDIVSIFCHSKSKSNNSVID